MNDLYCKSLTQYSRRFSSEVKIGNLVMGGKKPIRIQTMTNTLTSDIRGTIRQIKRIVDAGAESIRVAVPSVKDIEALKQIAVGLKENQINIPLIVDIHFNPKLALLAAPIVDKVRINPGNYLDKKQFRHLEYTNEEYKDELAELEKAFLELINLCKKEKTAIRIGTNHGSLSDRIMSRYGDTPEGMAESAMEFLRICHKHQFGNVVISMKASNTRIMVYATRLLVNKMNKEGMNYPLHLGVTEAGEGEDGRIKSAVGIGALLADGIGDTIRVSLTEEPELELPVAKKLVEYFSERIEHQAIPEIKTYPVNPFSYHRRETKLVQNIGGSQVPVVISDLPINPQFRLIPDYIVNTDCKIYKPSKTIIPYKIWEMKGKPSNLIPLVDYSDLSKADGLNDIQFFLKINTSRINSRFTAIIEKYKNLVIVLETNNLNGYADQRAAIVRLIIMHINNPVIIRRTYTTDSLEDLQLFSAADTGGLFLDGFADGIWLSVDRSKNKIDVKDILSTAFGILQASRVRVSKTEYISCPSCGRTLFDLQNTTQKIRERTAHLKGLKIGIMGCIVNGPGEMADADYGYVGAGKGKITLYKGKEIIKRNLPESEAVEELINLIKAYGDWKE